jgi:diguanylate cyclase (GGDEF)-like protein
LVLPETDGAAAMLVAERLRAATEAGDIVTDAGESFRLRISIGVAQWQTGEDEKSLLKRADMAMYDAKGMGRNQVTLAPAIDRVE